MRILHVVQGYTPAIGGTERLIQRISENLVALHEDEVTVYTTTAYNCELFWQRDQPQLPPGVEQINGVTVHRFSVFNRLNTVRRLLAGGGYKLGLPYNDWLRALYNGPIIPALPQAIADFGADVIAASSFPLLHMHYALWGGQRANIPVVFLGGIHVNDDFGFNRPMIYRAIQQADAYLAYTTFEKEHLVEQGIAPEKITVVGVGADMAPFHQANGRPLLNHLGWEGKPVIAYIGQQVAHKGIDLIMTAMPVIWHTQPDTCLLLAGSETSYSAVIQSWLVNLPLQRQSQVAIINNFAESEKAGLIAAADIVLYPSKYESFGIVFLEAWAARKPVIGLAIGAIQSVVEDKEDGLLIKPGNASELAQAVLKLLADPATRQRMGLKGHQKILEKYTWEVVVNKIRTVYQHVQRSYH